MKDEQEVIRMARPSKPFKVIASEKKSHRTKAELKTREENEKALNSNEKIKAKKEVKKNKIAYKEFKRIADLLEKIEKNDALYENVVNRYAMLYAECREFEEKRERFYKDMEKLDEEYEENDCFTPSEYFTLINSIQKHIIDLDKQIQTKRKMMLDIEKENVMTIASQLRSIPKKPEKDDNPLLKVLRGEA